MATLKDKRLLVLITGASRGIGREIAEQLAAFAGDGSTFILTARKMANLEGTISKIKEITTKRNIDLTIKGIACDMAEIDQGNLVEFQQSLKESAKKKFDVFLLIHNAGTVGNCEHPLIEQSDPVAWRRYFEENVTSMILLNNACLQVVNEQIASVRMIVNITSLLAVQAFPSFGPYSIVKAAREAFCRALACENPQSLRVLSYSPGPVKTDMHTEIAQRTFDAETRKKFSDNPPAGEGGTLHRATLTTEQTVTKLVGIVDKNEFENGGRIDYFDD